jgi:Holliday junction DNA helicase RuvA
LFSYIKGAAAYITDSSVVLEAGGIGYIVNVSPSSAAGLSPGQIVTLHTHMLVREDGIAIYGFLTRDERGLFVSLLSVSGLGPKGALSILGLGSVERVTLAIISDDAAALSKASGVGQKTAKRIIFDLKDKIGKNSAQAAASPDGAAALSLSTEDRRDALSALLALGYGRSDAVRAVLETASDDMSSEQIIKSALRKLHG